MTLQTSAAATLDRLRYTTQIRSVTAELAVLPGVNHAEVLIAAGVDVPCAPGADASIELDGGDGSDTVITGTVDHVDRRPGGTVVSVTDGGGALAGVRPQETYSGMPVIQVIRRLAELAGVPTGLIIAATQTAAYVADPRRTAAEHVAALAGHAGSVAAFDASGRLSVLPWPVGLPTAALRVDREFTSISTSQHRPGHEFAVVGAGGSAVALAPDAWLVDADPVTTADDPSATRTWRTDPVLRTVLDVDLANRAESARRAAATLRLDADCWLQPARRPGDVVQIQQTTHPSQAGPWLLTAVRHELSWDRAHTVLQGVSGGNPADLLGDLVAAVGDLL